MLLRGLFRGLIPVIRAGDYVIRRAIPRAEQTRADGRGEIAVLVKLDGFRHRGHRAKVVQHAVHVHEHVRDRVVAGAVLVGHDQRIEAVLLIGNLHGRVLLRDAAAAFHGEALVVHDHGNVAVAVFVQRRLNFHGGLPVAAVQIVRVLVVDRVQLDLRRFRNGNRAHAKNHHGNQGQNANFLHGYPPFLHEV